MDENTPMNRRRFFREGLRQLLRPLASSIEPIEKAAHHLARLDPTPAQADSPRRVALKIYLRPPSTLDEKTLAEKCNLCGDCVKVCPAQAIKIDPTKQIAGGLPYIDADVSPCVVCSGLHCMHECPTGALVPIPMRQIDMGLAHWHADTCVRSKGQSCTICVDQCPLGSAAIEILGRTVRVIEKGCIGCGVCQFACPTNPKSIMVELNH